MEVGGWVVGALGLPWEKARDAAIEGVNDAVTPTGRIPQAKRASDAAFEVAWSAAPEDEKKDKFWKLGREAAAYAAAGLVVRDRLEPEHLRALYAPFAEVVPMENLGGLPRFVASTTVGAESPMSGDPNNDQVQRFFSEMEGLSADAWGEVVHHAFHVAEAPIYNGASQRLVTLIRDSGRAGQAMAADLQMLDAINAASGLQQLDAKYRDDQRLLDAAGNATKAMIFRELLTQEEFATLLYPFDMVLKPELRELSQKVAAPSRGCMARLGSVSPLDSSSCAYGAHRADPKLWRWAPGAGLRR